MVDQYDLFDVARRDGWTCHLCGEQCDPALPVRDRGYPTVDHIVPISAGGKDSLANVALAHRGCNSRRRDVPLELFLARA